MSNRFQDAQALVDDARKRLGELTWLYERSLNEKTIGSELKVAVKGILDNLRSSLDYCAREVSGRCGGARAKVYFPITSKGGKQSDFRGIIGKNVPGVVQARPDLVALFESFQEFTDPANAWLPNLATLSNDNKHDQLTAQTRVETPRVTVRVGSGSVAWDPRAVRFGPGVFISGVPIDPVTQLPAPSPHVQVENQVWVSIAFETIQEPVLPFLQACVDGVEDIVRELSEKL